MVWLGWRSAVLGAAIIAGSACGESSRAIVHGTREDGESGGRRGVALPDHSTGSPVLLVDPVTDAGVDLDSTPPQAGVDSSPPPRDDAGDQPDDPAPAPVIPDDAGVEPLPVQVERCGEDESCDLRCETEVCAMDCAAANTCKVDCGRSARCEVSCVDANNCEPKCSHGECEIDCYGANNCDHVRCGDDASCIVHCGDDTNCKIEGCAELTRCPGNVLVCNRACP